jgi:hypothetical protein
MLSGIRVPLEIIEDNWIIRERHIIYLYGSVLRLQDIISNGMNPVRDEKCKVI